MEKGDLTQRIRSIVKVELFGLNERHVAGYQCIEILGAEMEYLGNGTHEWPLSSAGTREAHRPEEIVTLSVLQSC
jgi:hypothetical protein